MMKVWIESPFDNLPEEGFRKQRYYLMAEAFKAAGHEVVYWTSNFNHGTKQSRRIIGDIDNSAIKIELLPVLPYQKNVSVVRILSHYFYAKLFKHHAAELVETGKLSKPDLVIAATPTLGAAKAAMELARKYGAKFALDIQDAWPETFYRLLPVGFKWLGKLLFLPMAITEKKLYREADVITGVSRRYQALTGRNDFYLAYHGIAKGKSV